MSFLNKVVIVTGGSSGIGAATALLFAKEAASVVIVGRNETNLRRVAEEIAKTGKKPLVINADVSKHEDAQRIIEITIEEFGKIDVLVNNAGIMPFAGVDDEKAVQIYDKIFNTNVRSIVLLTSLAASYLKQTKGNIVNISSVAAKHTLAKFGAGYAIYCASKAAVDQFTRSSAMELGGFGVRVNSVSPGPVQTSLFETAGLSLDFQDIADKNTALKTVTFPQEIADLIMYLASDKAKSVTGSDYVCDGGMMIC